MNDEIQPLRVETELGHDAFSLIQHSFSVKTKIKSTLKEGRNILMFNMRATLIAIKCGSLMVHVVGVSNMNPKQKNEEKEPQNDVNKSLEL